MKAKRIQYLPLPRLNGLGGFAEEARAFTDQCLRTSGSVPPMLLAITPRGLIIHELNSVGDEESKELFAQECRLLLTATQATMCAMIMEAWITDIPDETLHDTPPSQSPSRREVVTICAERRKEQRFLILPIRRDAAGGFLELGENRAPEGMTAAGRFAQILSLQPPRHEHVEAARRTLERMGIQLANDGSGFSKS